MNLSYFNKIIIFKYKGFIYEIEKIYTYVELKPEPVLGRERPWRTVRIDTFLPAIKGLCLG